MLAPRRSADPTRTVRDQFLVEITDTRVGRTGTLSPTWTSSTGCSPRGSRPSTTRREHSETGAPPLARWHAGGPFPLPAPAALAEAFLWEAHRTVTKTALVSLQANTYRSTAADRAPGRVGVRPVRPHHLAVRVRGTPPGSPWRSPIGRHSHAKAHPETARADTGPDRDRLPGLIPTPPTPSAAERINYTALLDSTGPSTDGADGTDGTDGTDGADGADGAVEGATT